MRISTIKTTQKSRQEMLPHFNSYLLLMEYIGIIMSPVQCGHAHTALIMETKYDVICCLF